YIKPFILRRMKTDVLTELPEKIETRLVAEMSEAQQKIYMAYLMQAKEEMRKELADKGFEKSQFKILSILTRLRQICCHPALIMENYSGESGKMTLLEEVFKDAIEGGHRILLFSQFTSMLGIIRQYLDKQHIEYYYLDGQTPTRDRSDFVRAFNGGSRTVFLISLKAGGVGLNLVGADTVIHYDPWWNPAVEDQATDRAYRIGQQNVVQVIKLIAKGTIEEKIEVLKQKKKALVEAVIQPGETFVNKLTKDEILQLFD
ncbi:MAG: DEAD/DEAH box helicase, partial [Hyphomonadaceae bacterium]|nr:DEAD/DEAH box helicase [Clostridia bacterium]